MSGAWVGGGSLGYANTLYEPPDAFFADPQWASITDWKAELAPFYDQAKRMLGVTVNPLETPADRALRAVADELGVGRTFRRTPVGVFFGDAPGVVADPFFGGTGPERRACTLCGSCMSGCRVGAKNTLVKNYLHLAERGGARVLPLTTVTSIEPTGDTWEIHAQRTGAGLRRGRRTITASRVVLAAGTWGTQQLLHRMRADGT